MHLMHLWETIPEGVPQYEEGPPAIKPKSA
jgi:hypothetical protein